MQKEKGDVRSKTMGCMNVAMDFYPPSRQWAAGAHTPLTKAAKEDTGSPLIPWSSNLARHGLRKSCSALANSGIMR